MSYRVFVRSVEIQQPPSLCDVSKADGDVQNVLAGIRHVFLANVRLVKTRAR